MCEHNHIRFNTDELPCDPHVGLQDRLGYFGQLFKVFHVPGHEDSGLKLGILSIIESLQFLYCVFIGILAGPILCS